MSFSLGYALVAFALMAIVFLVANRVRGLRFALTVTTLTFVAMFTMFLVLIVLAVTQMQ